MIDPVDILLVEDNRDDVELTLHALRKHHLENKVHVVQDGEQALAYMFAEGNYANRRVEDTPSLILLDLNLPRLPGLGVLRAVKADPRTQSTPVVVLTKSREGRDIKDAYDLGADSYIVKPVDFDKFVDAARILGLYWVLLKRPAKLA